MDNITIILITYKSDELINKFIKRIPPHIKTIIIENSDNHEFKKNIEKKYSNIKVYLKENNGVSTSLNYAVNLVRTDFFLQISPDIKFDFENLKYFFELSIKLNNEFAAIGPIFINSKKNNHNKILTNDNFIKTNSVHGSCMFINKKCYEKIGGFDNNIFLYFEETDYCKRGIKNRYYSYQHKNIKVESLGRSVNLDNKKFVEKLDILTTWHFIWSKFYFYKKHYGSLCSFIYFIPILIRIIFRINLYKWILVDEKKEIKYRYRLDGLINSIKGNGSSLRIENL